MENQETKGRVALITGAGRGIGKAIAVGLAKAGYDIAVISRTLKEIETTAREAKQLGNRSIAIRADVSELTDVRRVASELEKQFDRLDVLVNNAGLRMNQLGNKDSYTIPFGEVSVEDWDRAIAVNLRGPFLCIKEFLPLMRKLPSASIINVSAGGGRRGMAGRTPYCASKFGLEGLTQCLAIELREFNIAVNSISPGEHSILTDREKVVQLRRRPDTVYMSPAMMVPPVLFLARQNGSGISGQHVEALDWVSRNGFGGAEAWRVKADAASIE